MSDIDDPVLGHYEMAFPVVDRMLSMFNHGYSGILWVRNDLQAHVQVGGIIFLLEYRARRPDNNIPRLSLEEIFKKWEID
jgi:hypothetical protein